MPPAYYADLACERGRCYLNDFLAFEDPEKNKGIGKGKGKGKDKDKKREEERKRVYGLAEGAWGEGVSSFSFLCSGAKADAVPPFAVARRYEGYDVLHLRL